VRKPGSKKGPATGSGGKSRRALEGKGPTPKAEARPYHPAAKRAAEAAGRQAQAKAKARRQTAPSGGDRPVGGAGDYVVGRNSVLEALRARVPALRLDLAIGLDPDDRVTEAIRLATDRGLPIEELPKPDLERQCRSSSHQGIALKAVPYQYAKAAELLDSASRRGQTPLIVVLDSVTDPHNLGAVLRAGAAFGAHGLVIRERRSAQMGPTAWKVSAGAAARIPVARATNLVRTLEFFKDEGLFVVGLDGRAKDNVAGLPVATSGLVLVVGSEGKGLARLTREACDLTAAIEIQAATESLNAAVAAGIALYEVAKARRQPSPAE